jgi:hypothetical protein
MNALAAGFSELTTVVKTTLQEIRGDIISGTRSSIVTLPTSQLPSPNPEFRRMHIDLLTPTPMTEWIIYETTKTEKDYYINKLRPHFNRVNSIRYYEKYQLIKTRNSILIKDGYAVVFKSGNSLSDQRNLYLELYDSEYDIPSWLDKRTTLSLEYKNVKTPPDFR